MARGEARPAEHWALWPARSVASHVCCVSPPGVLDVLGTVHVGNHVELLARTVLRGKAIVRAQGVAVR